MKKIIKFLKNKVSPKTSELEPVVKQIRGNQNKEDIYSNKEIISNLEKVGESEGQQKEVEKRFLKYFKKVFRFLPKILKKKIVALYLVIKSEDVSMREKALAVGALAYFILPTDAIPDILGPMGFGDDLAVATAVLQYYTGKISDEEVGEFLEKLET